MDLRSKTIQDLLYENQQETQKWEKYREEQRSVENNLTEFQKKIEIDVLVPIGTKAFVPGVLYHTNEILISHFQGYFSKVTTKTALEILDHRVKLANNHLQKLEEEYDLFEPKLELPMLKDDGKEIIEEYNEENEQLWRAKHRESVKRMKLEERMEQSVEVKQGDDLMDLLDEMELMEELEGELDKVQPKLEDTNEKLKQIISGELQLAPQKERKSHYQATSDANIKGQIGDNFLPAPIILNESGKSDNEVLIKLDSEALSNDEEDDDYDNIPLEIRILVESTKNLKITDKIKIFKKKLKTVKKSLTTMKIENETDLEEKLVQLEIKETLEEIIEDMEDNEEEEDEMDDEIVENETEDEEIQLEMPINKADLESSLKPKKKYTFNENVDICYINAKDPPRKISDDRNPKSENLEIDRPALKKVDIPLIKPKIDYEPSSTFSIRFNHSMDVPQAADQAGEIVENFTKDVISSPFEIFKLIKHKTDGSLTRKGKKGGKQAKFIAPPAETETSSKPLKSILKPGLVMNYESFSEIEEEEEGAQQNEEDAEQPCDFSKIMGEVTEHPIKTDHKSPEVSPQEVPVKISKFKQSRKKS